MLPLCVFASLSRLSQRENVMDFQEMPIGFAVALAQSSAAMEAYAALPREAKSDRGRGNPRPLSVNGQSAD